MQIHTYLLWLFFNVSDLKFLLNMEYTKFVKRMKVFLETDYKPLIMGKLYDTAKYPFTLKLHLDL